MLRNYTSISLGNNLPTHNLPPWRLDSEESGENTSMEHLVAISVSQVFSI